MSKHREEFVRLFGEENAELIELAAAYHMIEQEEGDNILTSICRIVVGESGMNRGSDEFRWAILIALSFQCLEVEKYRDYHEITCTWEAVDSWLTESAQIEWLRNHDGDVDRAGLMAGKYDKYWGEDRVQQILSQELGG